MTFIVSIIFNNCIPSSISNGFFSIEFNKINSIYKIKLYPIKNIQFIPAVVVYNNDKSQFKIFPRIDTTYTNERGEYYIIDSNDDGSGNASVGIYLNDIDGTQNGGEFESQQIIFDFSEVKLDTTNRNDWYRGSKTLYQDIVLEKKK